MLFIIGVYKEGHYIVGLKLYDSASNKIGMFYKRQVLEAVAQKNVEIAGIRTKVDCNGITKKELSRKIYNVKLLDQVDSKGNPIDTRHVRVPIYTEGFSNSMKITLVDSMGKLETVEYEKLLEMIKGRKVTGAAKRSTLIFSEWCETRGLSSLNAQA